MKLLLINKNPVVSRMLQMSVPKAGFELKECDNIYDLPSGNYEVVVVDDEMYDENFLDQIAQNINYHKLGIVTSAKKEDFANFDFVLTKPFLPTDLIEILRKIKADMQSQEELTPVEEREEDFVSLLEKKEKLSLKEEPKIDTSATKEPIVKVEEESEESPFVEEQPEKAGVLKEEEIKEVAALLDEAEAVKEEEPKTKPQSPEEEVEPKSTSELTPEAMLTVPHESEETSLNDLKGELQKLDVKGLRQILDGMQLEITIKISYPDRTDV